MKITKIISQINNSKIWINHQSKGVHMYINIKSIFFK